MLKSYEIYPSTTEEPLFVTESVGTPKEPTEFSPRDRT